MQMSQSGEGAQVPSAQGRDSHARAPAAPCEHTCAKPTHAVCVPVNIPVQTPHTDPHKHMNTPKPHIHAHRPRPLPHSRCAPPPPPAAATL